MKHKCEFNISKQFQSIVCLIFDLRYILTKNTWWFGKKSTFLTQNILLRAIAGLFSFPTIIIRKNGKKYTFSAGAKLGRSWFSPYKLSCWIGSFYNYCLPFLDPLWNLWHKKSKSESFQKTYGIPWSTNPPWGSRVVVKTFKNLTAERVQPAPIYLRYIRIPFQINCRASAERVQPAPIYLRYISTFIVNAVQK